MDKKIATSRPALQPTAYNNTSEQPTKQPLRNLAANSAASLMQAIVHRPAD